MVEISDYLPDYHSAVGLPGANPAAYAAVHVYIKPRHIGLEFRCLKERFSQTHRTNILTLLSDCIPKVARKRTAGKRFSMVVVCTWWRYRIPANDERCTLFAFLFCSSFGFPLGSSHGNA
ncbi:unnamed protein product, partial [Laminaria digitata]